MWHFYAIVVLLCFGLSGCATAPSRVSEVRIPVPVVEECKYPDYGPAPDLTELAALKATDDPKRIIEVINSALYELAKDDAHLRAMRLK